MSNFVIDLTPLPFPKSDLRPLSLTADPDKNITAAEWNTLCQDILDLRDFVLGSADNLNAWGFLGDSGILSKGVNTDQAVRWNNLVSGSSPVPDTRAVINTIVSNAASEPLTMNDFGTTDLKVHNVGAVPGYGWEFSAGLALFDLLNGAGTTPTTSNKPWLLVAGISGVELKQTLPGSTYGQASPVLGGLNWYNFVKARWLSLLAGSNRKLSGIFLGTLSGNDAASSPDANAVAANMVTLATQLRADFGPQVVLVWLKVHAQADIAVIPFRDTVRAQQVTGIATIPNSRLLVIDSYPLLGDNLHWGADPVWDMGLQQAEAFRQMRGIPARAVTQPTVVGYGTPDYNKPAGALFPRGYPLARAGDIELLFVGSLKITGSATTIPTPSGWTSLGNSSQVVSGETQEFALFSRTLSQLDLDTSDGLPPAVSITTGNDENYAVRVCIRGASGIDGSVIAYAATAFGTGGVNAGGTTTTGTNSLVLTWACGEGGGSSATEHFAAVNATTTPVLVFDAPLAQSTSNFGLLALFAGRKSTPGATGTTVITPSIVTNPSGFTVALKS